MALTPASGTPDRKGFRMQALARAESSLSAADALGEQPISRAQNFRVIGRQNVLGSEKHFLVQFFAGPDAGELDLYVRADFKSGKTNEISRDVDDSDLLAHVEDEDFTASSQRARLK